MLPLLPLHTNPPSAFDDPQEALRFANLNNDPRDLPVLKEYIQDQAEAGIAVVVDVETTQLIAPNLAFRDMTPSVASLLILEKKSLQYSTMLSFWPKSTGRGAPFELLIDALDAAKTIVAYNGDFDLSVLAGRDEARKLRWKAKLFDPFIQLYNTTGHYYKLDALFQANQASGLQPKPELGSDAPKLWHRGELDRLETYNRNDVMSLAKLVLMPTMWLPGGLLRSKAAHLPLG